MTAQSLRNVALGIMIATITCGTVYYATQDGIVKQPKAVDLTEDQLKAKLIENGYVVQTEDEYQEQLALIGTPEEPKEVIKEKIIYRTAITVVSGMTGIDVGESLKEAKILKDSMEFSQEVEKRKLEQDLKPGIYVVDSGMSLKEIIEAVYGK